jgi:sugar lactone lactonase YvrE
MVQAEDGTVYVGGWGDTLVYDADYRPLGKIPAKDLTGTPLDSLAVDGKHRLWAADDRGHLVRVTLPN